MNYTPCNVVAEIGATHIGNLKRAKYLVSLAALAGADYVKFQKRDPHLSTPEEMKNKPPPNERFSYGKTYLDHRINLELSAYDHAELKVYCESRNIGYATSVWDTVSAREIIQLQPDFIKIPSACNNNTELLDILFNEYTGGVHISTGMTSEEEMRKLMLYLNTTMKKHLSRVVIYHCTSEYPCPLDRLCIRELEVLQEVFPDIQDVGFSSHEKGVNADIPAYMLGARWLERHFIDDRTFRHTDSASSLEPEGLKIVCQKLKNLLKVIQYKREMSVDEQAQRKKLKGT